MFDLVQKHKRVLQVFLGLIALTFATWGIESYTRFAGGRDTVASVNGSDIAQREFDTQVAAQQEQIRRMFAGRVDPATFDTLEGRRAVLDQMINERVIATETVKRNLQIDDKRLTELLVSVPEFQENGRFSVEAFDRVARSQNPPLSSRQFAERLRQMFAYQQLVGAVGDTTIVAHTVADRLSAIEAQQREISEARIAVRQYLDKVKIDEAKAKEYYDANPAEFRTPERVRAEYAVLSAENLAKQETAGEDEIKKAYEARAAAFKVEEQRRASHILVKTKEEADKIVAEVKKNPGAFAELAKKNSQDPGSAEKGGDLGWFARGAMVKPFEDAVFSMKQGEIGVAQSEFGFHVARVTGIQPGKTRPLDEVRKELATEITKQKAAKKYTESAEAFGNMVYEQAESLKPAAERFKLQIQATGWISKGGPPQELGALDNPKLLAALFSNDAIANKRNTDAIEVAPNTLVAARVIEHQPAAQKKFEEVKEQIIDTLRRREAARLAEQDGAAKLEQLKKGESPALQWDAARMVSRRNAQGLPAEILRQVVAADASKLPAYVGVPIPDQGYVILRISKVVEGQAPADEKQAAARAAAAQGGADYEAYVATLKGRARISINSGNLEKK
ncbi:MAG TPA: SurA N-terminal domain-containing protein [Burkholderiales bacterium]|nr:SurA N-terminal domain-containing protein [Burkholderiales bacterium]